MLDDAPPGKPMPPPHASIELKALEGTTGPAQAQTDLTREVARGLVVERGRTGLRIAIGERQERGPTPFAPSPASPVRFALAARGAPSAKWATIEGVELGVPGVATFVVPPMSCDCAVSLSALSAERGAPVDVELEGTIGSAPRGYRVRVSVSTFVRDVVAND
jgi:hypothetical protein